MKKTTHHSITPSLLRLLVLVLALAPLPLLANDAVMAKPSVGSGLPQDLFQKLGAPAGTLLDKGNRAFDIRAYGASTSLADNASKFAATLTAAGSSPIIFVPAGVWRTSSFTLPSNCTFIGTGKGLSIIKVLDGTTGSGSNTLLIVPSSATNVTIKDMTLDGNRGHQGSYTVSGANSILFIGGTHVLVENVEITHSEVSGVFIGDGTISSSYITFSNCWIHDNGGAVDNAGIGVGIYSGGAVTPSKITITGCTIENNYNTVTKPNDSTALNLTANGVVISNCTFKNNYNVGGSQVAVTDNGLGAGTVNAVIANCFITKTGSFGTPADQTNGIEINGRSFSITNNLIDGFSASGINIEGAGSGGAGSGGGEGSIVGNTIRNGHSGIRLYGNATDPAGEIVVAGNTATTGITFGIDFNTFNDRVSTYGNNFRGASTSPYEVVGVGHGPGALDSVGLLTQVLGELEVVGKINGLTRTASDLAVKPSCGLVATSNLTLSGAQTIDSVAGTAGQTVVLCTAQTTASQNGPWVMQSGAWTRPDWYATGNTNQAFQFITSFVRLGALYSGTTWYCTTSDAITIGTTNTTWVAASTPAVISDAVYSSFWNGVTTLAPSKNALYDWAHTFDTDDDGKVNVLDVGAGITKTDSNGVVSVATAGTDYVAPSSLGIRARAYNSANISVANNSLVALTFNSETDDTDTMHSTSINTGRMTATTAGYYTFCTSLEFAPNATGSRLMSFRKNGSTRFGNVSLAADTNSGATTNISTCSDYSMSAGDYVEVMVFQNSGGNLNVNRNSDWTPIFSAKRNP